MEIHTDYLIIGGGIAGTTAAEAIRSKDAHGSIAIIGKEPYGLYSRVLLPKYIEGKISREQVFLRTSDDYNKRAVNLFSGEEATIIDVKRKEVRTRQGTVFFYEQLLISAGGRVKPWHVEGAGPASIFRLQTIDDADALRSRLAEASLPEAVIVGGGFITLELLNALVPQGMPVHCLLPESRYWEYCIDETGSALLETHLERRGVLVHRKETATMIQPQAAGGSVVFTNRRTSYKAAVVAVGIGLNREIEPFTGTGIEVDQGIKTNEFLETSVEDVWAAGDIAEFFHPVFGKHLLVGNWNNAFLQGRIAGVNMAARRMKSGDMQAFTRIPFYAIDVLGMHITFMGDVSMGKNTDGREYVSRFQEDAWYERFGMRDGKLVGAVIINKFEDRQIVERLIAEQRDITPFMGGLRDPSRKLADTVG